MKQLQRHEMELVGRWVVAPSGKMARDATSLRIEWLTKNALEQVAISERYGAWKTLFRDPSDGRLWERTYPEGHLQGGGPPMLSTITEEQARRRYTF